MGIINSFNCPARITPQESARRAEANESQMSWDRHMAVRRLREQLDGIDEAIAEAETDPQCRKLQPYLNSRGQLVIGLQSELDTLLETVQGLRFVWEAVGVEPTGEIKPIDDLSYKPVRGWSSLPLARQEADEAVFAEQSAKALGVEA